MQDLSHVVRGDSDMKTRLSRQNSKIREVVDQIYDESVRYGGGDGLCPWMNEEGNILWDRSRIILCKIVDSQLFERFMGLLIVFNLVVIIIETDKDASCYPEFDNRLDECPTAASEYLWIIVVNYCLLVMYTIEMVLRFYVWRLEYLRNRWNLLDGTVVLAGWITDLVGGAVSFGFLRIFRIMRLLRAARILISIRELYMLLNGLLSSMRAIFFGSFILFAMLVLWAILLVQFVHPINSKIDYGDCTRCPRGLASVPQTCLTLFQQIVAGDSWGLISIPIIEEEPWTAGFMVAIVITVSLGVMNLILAVIVERATEARQNDIENTLKEKEKERKAQKLKLVTMCSELDTNNHGVLALEDLRLGFANHLEFRDLLRLIDVRTEKELEEVYKILDQDKNGELTAKEFCDSLHDMRSRDTRMTLVFIKAAVLDIKIAIDKQNGQFAEVAAQKAALNHHTTLLEDISQRLEGMSLHLSNQGKDTEPSGAICGEGASASSMKEPRNSQGFPGADAVDPWVLSAVPPVSNAEGIAEELKSLRQGVDDLVMVNDKIVNRVQDQAAMLLQNVDFLSALQSSLSLPAETQANAAFQPSAGGQPSAGQRPVVPSQAQWPPSSIGSQQQTLGLTQDVLDRLGEQIWQLKRNTRQRLKVLLHEIEEKVDEEAAMLVSNSNTLDALGEMLGSPAGSVASRPRSRPASSGPSREMTRASFGDGPKPPKVNPPPPASGGFDGCKCTSMQKGTDGTGNIMVPADKHH